MPDKIVEKLDLFRREDGRLILRNSQNGEEKTPVRAVCCFPWTHRRKYLSVRDDKERELFFIEDLELLDEKNKTLLEEEMSLDFFIPKILTVHSIERKIELFLWKVETSSGPRNFLTTRDAVPRTLPDGRILIKDVGNDLYLIEDPASLNSKSCRLLWAYLD